MIYRVPSQFDPKSPRWANAAHTRYHLRKIPITKYVKLDRIAALLRLSRTELLRIIEKSRRIHALQFDENIFMVHPDGFAREAVKAARAALLKTVLKDTAVAERPHI